MASDPYAFSAEGRQSTKVFRTAQLANADKRDIPETYLSNTNKEELCLEYVRNFDDKFRRLYPKREDLMLVAVNEYGVDKFIPTTLRPTLLPFREVYDVEEASAFVANYLHFEPLEVRTAPPSSLPSPTQVLDWCVGDCFDFAMLLCSFLLGAGYDAFVVHGKAPRWVCLRDQSGTKCPLLVEEGVAAAEAKAEAAAAAEKASKKPLAKYVVPPRLAPVSKYEAARAAEEAEAKAEAKEEVGWVSDDDDEGAEEKGGEAKSSGALDWTHCWVLVRGGKRDREGFSFIEPTTGQVYPTTASPYLSVDAIWNARNYFVNMQGSQPVSKLNFDTFDGSAWEYVFIDPAEQLKAREAAAAEAEEADGGGGGAKAESGDGEEKKETEGGAGEGMDEDNILDIPPSWVKKLVLPQSFLKLKFPPLGQRTITFLRSKLELFADNVHEQGMTMRLTIYKDKAQTIVKECREKFLNRRDKLDTRTRYPLEGKIVEDFLPGRPGGLKCLTQWVGRRKEVDFYVMARQDGLCRREEELGRKIIDRYEGRLDKMSYRSVTVHEDTSGGAKPAHTLPGAAGAADLVAHKMAVKYDRNEALPASLDVSKRSFYLSEGRIRTLYHYGDGRITREMTVHYKDRHLNAQQSAAAAEGKGGGGGGGEGGADHVADEHQAVLTAERDTLHGIRRLFVEVNELLKARRREEGGIVVDEPIFDSAPRKRREEEARARLGPQAGGGGGGGGGAGDWQDDGLGGGGSMGGEEGAGGLSGAAAVDYLTPFLSSNVLDPTRLTRDEAGRTRDACLKSLKDRLLERANIIQNRLNEENARLSKKQATFQRNSSRDNDPAAEEEFEKFCEQAMFTIGILEQRLVTHEETALKKYQVLDERLSADPRLAALGM